MDHFICCAPNNVSKELADKTQGFHNYSYFPFLLQGMATPLRRGHGETAGSAEEFTRRARRTTATTADPQATQRTQKTIHKPGA
jgi:hypothetical protein